MKPRGSYLNGIFRIAVLATVCVVAGPDANLDYRVNQSAEYYRTLNRNGALDGADIVKRRKA